MSALVIRVFEGQLLPDNADVIRLLATEDVPAGTGTNTRRCYTLLVHDTRYWLTDAEKNAAPITAARDQAGAEDPAKPPEETEL